MKKLSLLIFLLFSFTSFADDKINFENYLLKGIFKRQYHRKDYFWSWDFRIFNNNIFITFQGDLGENDGFERFPNGEHELTTENGSRIKIKTVNGIIQSFTLLSDKTKFKESEKDISNDYCNIAIFYSNYDKIYKKFKHKFYYIDNDFRVMDIIKYKNKIIACHFNYDPCTSINDNSKYIFVDDKTGESRNFIITKNNKIMLQNIPEEYDLEPDITIKNCEIIINPKSNTSIF